MKSYIIPVLSLLLSVAAIIYLLPRQKNIVTDAHLWKSEEWRMLKNPSDNSSLLVSRYGGSEIRFSLKGSKYLNILSSSSNYAKHQGISVYVNDTPYILETPELHDGPLTISLSDAEASRESQIRIRHHCAGSTHPCDLAIRNILVERDATIREPKKIPNRMLAIIGDSISVGFGQMNYSYILADMLGLQLHNASIFGSTVSTVEGWDSAGSRFTNDINAFSPDIILVVLGTNDLGHSVKIEYFQIQYERLVKGLLTSNPKSHIYLVGIFDRSDMNIHLIDAYKSIISRTGKLYGVGYIDPAGWLDRGDYQDDIHPSLASQHKIADKMYQEINRDYEKKVE